ncbi:MAG TPA: MotA/TolQ/ExbB proton channel family protein [Candidatus Limnocylindria bacterium]|nr:MotA/TolQ/ExbB proton channel family protein [Candidatus Limnocylindria bacterium]
MAADDFNQAVQKAALDYAERLRQANVELTATRAKIAADKAPMLSAMRVAEDRLIAAQEDMSRRTTAHDQADETRHRLQRDAEALLRNRSYITSVAQDGLKAFADATLPGESEVLAEPLRALQDQLDNPNNPEGKAPTDVADFLFSQVARELGGATVPGRGRFDNDNVVLAGSFAFVGPEVYFRSDKGRAGLVLRPREEAAGPVAIVHALPGWKAVEAEALFQGRPGSIPADPTVSKAFRLEETRGDLLGHIAKGGMVAYAIVGVGLLSLLLILMKTRDVIRLGVDAPAKVQAFLVQAGLDPAAAERGLPALKSATRELFATGLKFREQSKATLEEHLQALLLQQRLFAERRLPLLAVIATASPLMGLLGTVVGMVRTFALITVFGTGNAGKLAGGISEVLVATELGLLVAIPTLVAHGFLAHRVHKKLGMLEHYALEFVTTVKAGDPLVDAEEDVPA